MSFTSVITKKKVLGPQTISWGTFANSGGDSGGDVDTGLKTCDSISLTHKGSAVVTNKPVVNETLPVLGSAVTIKTDADTNGYWLAIGTG